MPKATQVKAEMTVIPEQRCVECGKKIGAPWGRVDGGKWVCSASCDANRRAAEARPVSAMSRMSESSVHSTEV